MASDITTAILLGIVEGLTEFIPVSSTGHLILASDLLGQLGEKEKVFDVFIQFGAILAVVVLFRERFQTFFRNLFPLQKWFQRSTYSNLKPGLDGSSGILNVIAASVPGLVLGLLLHKASKALFFPRAVAVALIVGGIAFFLVETLAKSRTNSRTELTLRICFLIGFFQALALWPGISRSGATIVGALLLGVQRQVAAEFSFIIAVPLIAAAACFDLLKGLEYLSLSDVPFFLTGLGVSFVSGMLSIKLLIEALKRYSLKPFGVYRIALGILVLFLK